jgi:hypothetical protein
MIRPFVVYTTITIHLSTKAIGRAAISIPQKPNSIIKASLAKLFFQDITCF